MTNDLMVTGSRRNRGPREGDVCGSWVATYQRAAPSVGPRYTCTRRYHPRDDLHHTADKTRWWLTGDKWARRTGDDPPDDPARHRAIADAMKVGPTIATLIAANTSGRANPDTTDTERREHDRQLRADLDTTLAAALPRSGGDVRRRILALQRALASHDRQRARTEPPR